MKIKAEKIFERDQWTCQMCGQICTDGSLVPHHRGNRGMGGNPTADTPSNCLALCSLCNGVIEANPVKADEARKRGIKVSKFDIHRTDELPVEGFIDGTKDWILLTNNYERASTKAFTKLEFIEGTC